MAGKHKTPSPLDPLGKTGDRRLSDGSLTGVLSALLPLKDFSDPLIGQVVSGYKITRLLGAGGMGRVYHGEALNDPRYPEVALKFLSPQVAENETARRRFLTEFSVAMNVKHPNVARAIKIDEHDRLLYFVMEFLRGNDLDKILRVGRWNPIQDNASLALMVRILTQVCNGIHAAHQLGVIHRDLKPENIILLEGTNGEIKIIDMGIARMELGDMTDGGAITADGTVVGTPYYMSPEAAIGGPCDARSDIYSLGAVMYLLLTGEEAFDGKNPAEIMVKQVTKELTPPSKRIMDQKQREVVIAFEPIVLRAMEKKPERRFQDMLVFKAALEERAKILGLDVKDGTVIAPTISGLLAVIKEQERVIGIGVEPEVELAVEEKPPKGKIWPRIIVAATIVVAVVAGAVAGWFHGREEGATGSPQVEEAGVQRMEGPTSTELKEKKPYEVFVSTEEPAFAEIRRTEVNGLIWFESKGRTPLRITFDKPELIVIRPVDEEKAPVLIEVDQEHPTFENVGFGKPIPATE